MSAKTLQVPIQRMEQKLVYTLMDQESDLKRYKMVKLQTHGCGLLHRLSICDVLYEHWKLGIYAGTAESKIQWGTRSSTA